MYPWESAEEAVREYFDGDPAADEGRRRQLLTAVCDEIATLNIQRRQQAGMTQAGVQASLALQDLGSDNVAAPVFSAAIGSPPRPDASLETFIRDNFETLLLKSTGAFHFHRAHCNCDKKTNPHAGSTGTDLYPGLEVLLSSAKLFVQERIAAGERALAPEALFALYLFTLDSSIQRRCVAAMSEPGSAEAAAWSPAVYHIHRALEALPGMPETVLYRGIRHTVQGTVRSARRRREHVNTHARLDAPRTRQDFTPETLRDFLLQYRVGDKVSLPRPSYTRPG